MSVWTIACLVLAVFFAIISVIFAILKEKAAILISGFNTLPKEEREKYDKKKMSEYMRNSFLLWFGILLLGAILSYLINNYFAMISITVWVIIFFREIHFNPEKAFVKYRKEENI